MKMIIRVFMVLVVITILTACSGGVKVHEDVDKELAKDTLKFVDTIMRNFDKNIKRDDVSKKDDGIIADYNEKYIEDSDPLAYEGENANKEILMGSMWAHIIYMEYVDLPEDDIDEIMQQMVNTINWHIENGNEENPVY